MPLGLESVTRHSLLVTAELAGGVAVMAAEVALGVEVMIAELAGGVLGMMAELAGGVVGMVAELAGGVVMVVVVRKLVAEAVLVMAGVLFVLVVLAAASML